MPSCIDGNHGRKSPGEDNPSLGIPEKGSYAIRSIFLSGLFNLGKELTPLHTPLSVGFLNNCSETGVGLIFGSSPRKGPTPELLAFRGGCEKPRRPHLDVMSRTPLVPPGSLLLQWSCPQKVYLGSSEQPSPTGALQVCWLSTPTIPRSRWQGILFRISQTS